MDNVVEQLKSLKEIKPRAEWVNSSRELLLSQISAQAENSKTSTLGNIWFLAKSAMPTGVLRFVAQPIGVLTVILTFVVGTGVFGVNASKTSLPGDLLYPVKLTSEKVTLSLTINEVQKAKKHLEYAAERAQEIEAVTAAPLEEQEKKSKIKQAASGLVDQMQQAENQLIKVDVNILGQGENKKVVEVALGVDKQAEEISQKISIQQETYKEDKEMGTTLNAVQASINKTSVMAVEVVINGVETAKIDLPTKEIMGVIQKKIDNTAVMVEEAKTASEHVGVLVTESEASKTEATAEGTVPVATTVSPVDVVLSIKDKQTTAATTLSEAEALLNQGDLTRAIEMIKTTVEITNEVKDTASQIEATLVTPAPVTNEPTTVVPEPVQEVQTSTDVIIEPIK